MASRDGPTAVSLGGVNLIRNAREKDDFHSDLYENARQMPLLLAGRRTARSTDEMLASGLTRHGLHWRSARGRIRHPHRGLYLAKECDLLDLARAALSVCPPGTVLGYHTAAALLGFGIMPSRKVHVVVGPDMAVPQRRGIVAHQSVLPIEPAEALGLPCTPAARCAVDLARTLGRADALPVLDAALHSRACDLDDLLGEVKLHDGLRGVRQARELVPLADPRPQCRQESHLRLILHDGGLPGFVPQWPVRDHDGVVRYYLDLANPRTRVAAEYDGSSHLERLRNDRERHNWLDDQGWRMRYLTAWDLYDRPNTIVPKLIRAARERR
jgi:very-short-patch-repair endonuclease